jgi:hypothetical protein
MYRGKRMFKDGLRDGHEWMMLREVQIVGKKFLHRQCRRCWRDFVMPPDVKEWIAVHVGVFSFDFLDDEVNRKWRLERCPGRQFRGEFNDIRVFRDAKLPKSKANQ